MKKVSVIIPAYNAGAYLNRALKSISSQTFSDWECILVNDGSCDQTRAIADEYASQDSRFVVIHQTNEGVSAARNRGLQEAKGKYVCFADADDELEADCLQLTYEAAETAEADITVYGFSYCYSNQAVKTWLPRQQNSMKAYCEDWIARYGINSPCNKLFVRDKIRVLFDVNHSMGEDLRFCCEYLKNVERVVVVEKPLYRYYCEAGNSLTKNMKSRMDAIIYDTESLKNLIEKFNFAHNVIGERSINQILGMLMDCRDTDSMMHLSNLLSHNEALLYYLWNCTIYSKKLRLIRYLLLRKHNRLLNFLIQAKKCCNVKGSNVHQLGCNLR